MGVDEREGDGANPRRLYDLGVDGRFVSKRIFAGAGIIRRACCGVEVIDELAKENTHQWERNAGRSGRQHRENDQKYIDPCRVRSEEELREDEEVLESLEKGSITRRWARGHRLARCIPQRSGYRRPKGKRKKDGLNIRQASSSALVLRRPSYHWWADLDHDARHREI